DDIHGAPGGAKPPEVVGKIEAQKPPKPMKEYEEAEERATTVSAKSGTSKGNKGGGKTPKEPVDDPTAGAKKREEKISPDFSEEEPTNPLGSKEPPGEVIAGTRVIVSREVVGSKYKVYRVRVRSGDIGNNLVRRHG